MATEPQDGISERNLPAVVDQVPQNRVLAFAREHPVAAVAGAAAVGILVSAFLPKRATSRLAGRAAQLFEIISVAGMALGRDALERAGETGGQLRRRGGDLADRAGTLGGSAYDKAQRVGGRAADRIEDLIAPAARAAGTAGGRIIDAAEKVRKRIRS